MTGEMEKIQNDFNFLFFKIEKRVMGKFWFQKNVILGKYNGLLC